MLAWEFYFSNISPLILLIFLIPRKKPAIKLAFQMRKRRYDSNFVINCSNSAKGPKFVRLNLQKSVNNFLEPMIFLFVVPWAESHWIFSSSYEGKMSTFDTRLDWLPLFARLELFLMVYLVVVNFWNWHARWRIVPCSMCYYVRVWFPRMIQCSIDVYGSLNVLHTPYYEAYLSLQEECKENSILKEGLYSFLQWCAHYNIWAICFLVFSSLDGIQCSLPCSTREGLNFSEISGLSAVFPLYLTMYFALPYFHLACRSRFVEDSIIYCFLALLSNVNLHGLSIRTSIFCNLGRQSSVSSIYSL